MNKLIAFGTASIIVLAIAISMKPWSVVQNGEVGIMTEWGKASSKALPPGFYWYNPIGGKVVKLDTKVRTVSQTSEAASRDLQNVDIEITLNYHLGALDPVNHFIRLGNDQEGLEKNIVK